MPVESNTVEYTYTGDGVSTVFPFPSLFFASGDILVGVNGVLQSGGYSVAGAGNPAGGSVTFTAAPAAAAKVVLLRKPPVNQLIDFVSAQTVLEGVLDRGLDKLTMIAQYLLRGQERSVQVSELSGLDGPLVLAEADPDKALVWSADGNLVNSDVSLAALAAALDEALGLGGFPPGALDNFVKSDGTTTMTGPLTLSGDATDPLHAVPFRQLGTRVAFSSFGAKDDNGTTNNDTAWALMKASIDDNQVLELDCSNTGVYYFATTNDFTGVKLGGGANPKFRGPNVALENPGGFAGLKVSVVAGTVALGNSFLGDKVPFVVSAPPPEKYEILGEGDVTYEKVTAVNMAAVNCHRFVWPNANTFTAGAGGGTPFTGVTLSTNFMSVDWSTAPTNSPIVAAVVPEAACQYTWQITDAASATKFAMIEYEGGYHAVYGTASATIKKLTAPSTYTEVAIPTYVDGGTQADYFFGNGSITIDMITPTQYQVGINGVVYYEDELPSPATYIGAGLYRSSSAALATYVNNMTKTQDPVRLSPYPVRALFLGDSKTDKVWSGWPDDITNIMAQSFGLQWEFGNNVAVQGHNIAQQEAVIAALNVLGYTDVFVALGTNDAQGVTSYGPFLASFDNIIIKATSLGARVHILLTPPFYTRADAVTYGGFGQNSVNSTNVPFYREALRRRAADWIAAGKKISITSLDKASGPVLARYLDWVAGGMNINPVHLDNIHENRLTKKLYGVAGARNVFGLMTPKRTKFYKSTAIPSTWFQNSWANFSNAVYYIDADGTKHLDGIINTAGATIADGTVVMILPTFLRPSVDTNRNTVTEYSGFQGWVNILAATGEVKVWSVDPARKYIRLSDISWR